MSIYDVARTGDRRRTLEEIRDKLARAMDVAEPNVAANISGQLRSTLAELAGMGGAEVAKRNELGDRRAQRIAGAATGAPAVKAKGKRGA